MRHALEALIIALLVVALLTPLVRLLALRMGAVAQPGGRHVHQTVIPRLGGLAIAVGFCAAIGVLYFTAPDIAAQFRAIPARLVGVVVGGIAMCAVGVIDDTRGIRAIYKLMLQIMVAVFAYGCGLGISAIHLPLVGNIHLWALSLPLTVLWIVGVINAVNLIDGLDGLAAGVVFFAALTNIVVAWLSVAPVVAVLSGAIAGSVVGFLIYNFNPARIFMGDSGSYFLGYVLATTALNASQKNATAVSLLVPIMALGVPIFDTLFAMVRRFLERRPLFSPDRGHIHHRLLDMGLTHRRAVIIIYAVCGIFTVAAIGVSLERTWQVGAALLGASLAMVGLVRFVGYFEYLHLRIRQKARIRSRDVELLRRGVPTLPVRFGEARSEDELMEELFTFAEESDLGYVEVYDTRDGGERIARRWSASESADRDLVTAMYPLGRDGVARASVRFGWRSEQGDVSPQSDILLQVASDVLAENLVRLRSILAPATVSDDPHELEAELVPVPARHSRY